MIVIIGSGSPLLCSLQQRIPSGGIRGEYLTTSEVPVFYHEGIPHSVYNLEKHAVRKFVRGSPRTAGI